MLFIYIYIIYIYIYICFKSIQQTEKKNVNLAPQANHHYVAIRSLTLLHFKVTKHSKYKPYFTNSIVKSNSSFT